MTKVKKTDPLWAPGSESFRHLLEDIVNQALQEDIGSGDITGESIIPKDLNAGAEIVVKEPGIIAGLEAARACFQLKDRDITFDLRIKDGTPVEKGNTVALLTGRARSILAAERVALNFMQRMSGIATLTRQLVEAVKGTKAVILDTRKTAPGLRMLDKWAVLLGGGQNHRYGLFDRVLIKENHIAVAGGVAEAVKRARENLDPQTFIEVEVRNMEELQQAIHCQVNQIMLDNMDLPEMREAVRITQGRIPLEASGNITLRNIARVARTGVDFISTGMLTHSVKALDISLLFQGTIHHPRNYRR